MHVSPVGNPLVQPARSAVNERREAEAPRKPAVPTGPSAQPGRVETGPERNREELRRLADEVLSAFEDSPERLEQLVATLKRLEGDGEKSG
jgi:hypothetical protein